MDAVEEIKRKVDLVEHIGRVTKLQKSGRNFRGLCPFHTEKTPSFYVFPDRGTWRCFGSCGEGGDLFTFVQKRENLDFRAALRELAREAGIQLTVEDSARRSRNEKLMALMSAAVEFYQRQFAGPDGDAAREYILEKRGLTQRAVDSFRIGWAPDGWRNLRDYLLARGYEDRDMVAAGLLVEPESGREPYDRFRGRVIIPIADERGQYVAMGGRGLQGEEPKYLNSPQTDIFDKGRTLFGLHLAHDAIRASSTAVVVEGYMDVMGPWQAGFENVVATMGTSLTEQHALLLKRWAKRVVLAMDPDAAGMAAAERAGTLFMSFDTPEAMAKSARSADALVSGTSLELRVAPLPPGRDPDEVARDDPEGWRRAIDGAPPYAEFLIRRLLGSTRPASPAEARAVVDRLRPVLMAVRDPVERGMYVQRIARQLGVREDDVVERIRLALPSSRGPRQAPPQPDREGPSQEEVLLAIFLIYPELRQEFSVIPESLFTRAIDREIYRRWDAGEDLLSAPDDDPVAAYARRLAARRLPPLPGDLAARAARTKISEITRERMIQHQAAVTEILSEQERELGTAAVARTANEAWHGLPPSAQNRDVADTAIEDLQLGLSIHRREGEY